MSLSPIGIFDSGIGGLTVAAGIVRQFPSVPICYFGDTAHLPYGDKSVDSIRQYAHEIVEFLLDKGCKTIVIACNSASASAYESLRDEFSDRAVIIDVIRPLVDVVKRRHKKKVGVIATKATVGTNIYANLLQNEHPQLNVVSLATSLLVPMIEEGFLHNKISEVTIHQYLSYPDFLDIEALLLACTHYPLIRQQIRDYLGEKVEVYDSIEAVLIELSKHIQSTSSRSTDHSFWVSDYTQRFEEITRLFYGEDIKLNEIKWRDGKLVY